MAFPRKLIKENQAHAEKALPLQRGEKSQSLPYAQHHVPILYVCCACDIYPYVPGICSWACCKNMCYGYSFLNVHAVRVRETRIMCVWCTRAMCLSHHVMRHMVRLCVYKQVSHSWQDAFPFSHFVLEGRMLACSCRPLCTHSHKEHEMQKRGARCPGEAQLYQHAMLALHLLCYTKYCVLHALQREYTVYFMSTCPVSRTHPLFAIYIEACFPYHMDFVKIKFTTHTTDSVMHVCAKHLGSHEFSSLGGCMGTW